MKLCCAEDTIGVEIVAKLEEIFEGDETRREGLEINFERSCRLLLFLLCGAVDSLDLKLSLELGLSCLSKI